MPAEDRSFNQQPEWINSGFQDALPMEQPVREPSNEYPQVYGQSPVARAFQLRARYSLGDLVFHDDSSSPIGIARSDSTNSDSSMVNIYASPSIYERIVCEKHRSTLRDTVTFTVDGTSDTYCMKCVMDLLRERISPINQSSGESDSTSEKVVQRFSRYDLLKGKDACSECQ